MITNSREPLDPGADPDLAHLLDLLSLLPGPAEDHRFWAAVQDHHLKGSQLGYVYEKMTAIWRVIHDQDPRSIVYLAKYLLVFFSGDSPELWKILNHITVADFHLNRDDAGRLWAEDVCKTAWALYVRYRNYRDERWKAKWRYQNSWHEWLPDKG